MLGLRPRGDAGGGRPRSPGPNSHLSHLGRAAGPRGGYALPCAMIPTFVTGEEARELERLATGRRVLELGAQFGFSTVALARTARAVWSVDWHFGDPDAGEGDSLRDWSIHTSSARRAGRVVGLVGRFEDVLPFLRPASFGLLFHDGGHSEAEVRTDLELALPLLGYAAAVAVHDWELFGVSPACLAILGSPDRVVGRLAVWEPGPGRSHSGGEGRVVDVRGAVSG